MREDHLLIHLRTEEAETDRCANEVEGFMQDRLYSQSTDTLSFLWLYMQSMLDSGDFVLKTVDRNL